MEILLVLIVVNQVTKITIKDKLMECAIFFSNTFMNLDTILKKNILKQILAFNSIFGISFSDEEGSNEVENF